MSSLLTRLLKASKGANRIALAVAAAAPAAACAPRRLVSSAARVDRNRRPSTFLHSANGHRHRHHHDCQQHHPSLRLLSTASAQPAPTIMASATTPAASLLALLARTHPAVVPASATTADIDLDTISSKLFPDQTYTAADTAAIASWLSSLATPDLAAINAHLATRTTVLGSKPSVADLATYAAVASTVARLTPEQRTGEDGVHHLVRHVAFVQNAPLFGVAGSSVPAEELVQIDVDDVKALPKPLKAEEKEGDKKKKEKKAKKGTPAAAAAAESAPAAAAADVAATTTPAVETKELPIRTKNPEQKQQQQQGAPATAKKEKKEKKPKQQKPAAAPAQRPSPSIIDLRVGHILRAVNHPNADSLYVSTIDCGDAPGTENTSLDAATGKTVRTVCSGLNGLVPLAEMQGRKIVAVCNLKPVTMRGVKSCAMVLAASPRPAPGGEEDAHAGPVELVAPPEGAVAGARLFFENWREGTPEKVLNPKKKIWEAYQPGFTTTEALEVGFEPSVVDAVKGEEGAGKGLGRLVSEDGGVCTVKSLKNAVVR